MLRKVLIFLFEDGEGGRWVWRGFRVEFTLISHSN
jgi:hypothetical protein